MPGTSIGMAAWHRFGGLIAGSFEMNIYIVTKITTLPEMAGYKTARPIRQESAWLKSRSHRTMNS